MRRAPDGVEHESQDQGRHRHRQDAGDAVDGVIVQRALAIVRHIGDHITGQHEEDDDGDVHIFAERPQESVRETAPGGMAQENHQRREKTHGIQIDGSFPTHGPPFCLFLYQNKDG